MDKETKFKAVLLIFLPALCWGPSFLFMKISVVEIPPLTLALLRMAIGALFLYPVCRFLHQGLLKWKHLWKEFIVMGVTLNLLPFWLISFAEIYIPSSLAGILNGLTLVFTAIFAHYFSHEKLTKNKLGGIILGLIGLAVIYVPLLFHQEMGNQIGVVLMVLACIGYGVGGVYARAHLHKVPGLVALTFQLILASLILLPFSLIFDRPFDLPPFSLPAWGGAAGLGIIGTAGGFFFYYRAIKYAGITFASLAVLFIPILAMIFGVAFLHEHLFWNFYLGAVLILIAILSINPMTAKAIK